MVTSDRDLRTCRARGEVGVDVYEGLHRVTGLTGDSSVPVKAAFRKRVYVLVFLRKDIAPFPELSLHSVQTPRPRSRPFDSVLGCRDLGLRPDGRSGDDDLGRKWT